MAYRGEGHDLQNRRATEAALNKLVRRKMLVFPKDLH